MDKITLEAWNRVYNQAVQVIKAALKQRGRRMSAERFEEAASGTTIEYFREAAENGKRVPDDKLFAYLWALSKRTSHRWEMELLDTDRPHEDRPRPFPLNLTRLQAQTPLGHLVMASAAAHDDDKAIRRQFDKYASVRSITAPPDVLSPYHGAWLSAEYWIQIRLPEFGLKPRPRYFVYRWGIATDDFDPRECGLYRTERVLETVEFGQN
jgi:hypothetical protein